MASNSSVRLPGYSSAAIALHWTIALLIVVNFALAWTWDGYQHSADPAMKAIGGTMVDIHKAVGLTVLTLSLVRLAMRVVRGFPRLPADMPTWERVLARGTHVLFYVLMIGVPLLGWATVSASPKPHAISWFGLFDWPRLPLAPDKAQSHQFFQLHGTLATVILITLALHVAGALKHQFFDRDGVLARMLPLVRAPR